MKIKKSLLYILYHDFHYECIFQISIEKGKTTPNYHGDVFLGGEKHHCIVFFIVFFFFISLHLCWLKSNVLLTEHLTLGNKINLCFKQNITISFRKKELKTEEKVNLGTYWTYFLSRLMFSLLANINVVLVTAAPCNKIIEQKTT